MMSQLIPHVLIITSVKNYRQPYGEFKVQHVLQGRHRAHVIQLISFRLR